MTSATTIRAEIRSEVRACLVETILYGMGSKGWSTDTLRRKAYSAFKTFLDREVHDPSSRSVWLREFHTIFTEITKEILT